MPTDNPKAPQVKTKMAKSEEKSLIEPLPYALGYLPEQIQQMAAKELKETEERKQKCLAKFRQLIAGSFFRLARFCNMIRQSDFDDCVKDLLNNKKTQNLSVIKLAEKNLFVRTDDLCLLAYLRGRKFDVDRAFKMMKNTYKLRMKKRFYDAEDNSVVHDVFRQNFIGFLPYRATNGSVIFIVKVGQWDPEQVDRDLLMWTVTHCMIHSIEDEATQVAGYSAIIDVRGVGNKHLKMLTVDNIMLIIHSTQNCFPGRYKSIHVIGMPKFFAYAWSMAYPFILTFKMQNRIFIHGENLKSLHKHFSPSILPEEYDGELGPFDNSEWHRGILKNNEWALEQRLYGFKS